jgi:predicted amidohydrolase
MTAKAVSPITVATFAMKGTVDKQCNLNRILACIDEGADAGADLIVLPEIALQGYCLAVDMATQAETLERIYRDAENVPAGPSVVAIAEKARQRGIHVAYGLTESGDQAGVVYNSAVLTGPDGHIGTYRKVHLAIVERIIWQCGNQWPVFATALGRIGMLICYDKAFPESCRELTLGGADILVMPTAWPSDGLISELTPGDNLPPGCSLSEQYELYDRVRALENARWFVSSNYTGDVNGAWFCGRSQIVDPSGRVVATSGEGTEEAMVLASIDVDGGIREAYANRLGAGLHRDRHPETYGRVAALQGSSAVRP